MTEMDQHVLEPLVLVGKPVALVLITAVVKSWRERSSNGAKRKSKIVEELEFISSFLAFPIERRERLVVEHAFSAHLKQKLDFEEISAILRFRNPSKGFSFLRNCRHLVHIGPGGRFLFKEENRSETKRRWKRYFYNFGYFALFYLGLLPVAFASYFFEHLGFPVAISFLLIWPLGLAAVAIDALRASINLDFAEKLMSEQDKLVG